MQKEVLLPMGTKKIVNDYWIISYIYDIIRLTTISIRRSDVNN